MQSLVFAFRLHVISTLHSSRILFKLSFEFIVFHRKNERLREKVVSFGEFFAHFHQITSQLVFVGHHSNARKLRNSLIRLQLGERFSRNWIVEPCDVEVRRITKLVPIRLPVVIITPRRRWQKLYVLTLTPKVKLL